MSNVFNINNSKILNYIGSTQNFSKIFNFLSNKNFFYINNNSIKLTKSSFDKISKLSDKNIYTYITLIISNNDKINSFSSNDQSSVDIIIDKEKYLFKNNFMVVDTNDNNEKKHKDIDFLQSKSEEEEEEFNSHSPLLSKKPSQNNNNNNEKDKIKLNSKNNNKNKINIEILLKLKNQNFITHNYEDILIYWEVLFCLLIIIGFNIFIHIMSVIVNLRIILNFYIFYCFVLSGLLLYIGTFSLIKIQKDLEKEIVANSIINELLILSIFLTFGVWIVICYLNKDLKKYILYQSYYNIIYISAILFEFFALIQNFMMNETYREYDYYLKKNKNNKDELKNINNNINNEILIN
jgi:hypothetical protein